MAPLSKNVKTNQIHRPVQAFCDTFFGFKNTLHHFESFNSMDRFKFPSSSKAHFPLPQQTPNFLLFFFCSGRGTARSRNLAPIFGDGIKFHGAPINSFESHLDGRLNWMENGHTEPIETPEAELVAAARF